MATSLPSLWASDRQCFLLVLHTRPTYLKEFKSVSPTSDRTDENRQEGLILAGSHDIRSSRTGLRTGEQCLHLAATGPL